MDAIKYIKYIVNCLKFIREKQNYEDKGNCFAKMQINKIKGGLFVCPASQFAGTNMFCDSPCRHLDQLSAHNWVVSKHSRII